MNCYTYQCHWHLWQCEVNEHRKACSRQCMAQKQASVIVEEADERRACNRLLCQQSELVKLSRKLMSVEPVTDSLQQKSS